ncbi:hypothetical protein Patl1_22349 [Pistacia atlantica]|uniref:Uncharacterized protein n=1 Tax=Pistacia atlantica TaxID=434234 RepID=A0ACC0ZW52_9ROSI|nr:hypothetical protein Patl1_22349 [Pistacia atlantica]
MSLSTSSQNGESVPHAIGLCVGLGSVDNLLNLLKQIKVNKINGERWKKGSAQLVKGTIEMCGKFGDDHGGDESNHKNRMALAKGKSLPKPPVNRQYS